MSSPTDPGYRRATNPASIALPPVALPSPNLRRIAHSTSLPLQRFTGNLIPLFYAALLFVAGIVLARYQYLRPGLLLAGLAPLAIIAVLAIFKAPRLAVVPLALIWLILGAWSAETEPTPATSPVVAQLSDGLLRTVEGTVYNAEPLRASESANSALEEEAPANLFEPGPPEAAEPKAQQKPEQLQSIDLHLSTTEAISDTTDSLTPVPATDKANLRLTVIWPTSGATPSPVPVRCGQRLRVLVRVQLPDTYHDPGVWSRAAYLQSQQISATSSVDASKIDGGEPRFAVLDSQPKTTLACLLNSARESAGASLQTLPALTRNLPAFLRTSTEDAAMLTAMLTGDRTYLTRSTRAGFERTGSFHLIVVSGLHLAILAGLIFALARRLRLPRLPATVITVAISLLYALFTGFAIPVQRSFWMVTLYLVGRLLYRNRSPLNVIGFASLCLLAASPRSIFEASLQMTLISVVAIVGVAVPLAESTLRPRIRATANLRLISIDPALPPKIAQFRVTLRLLACHLEPATSSWFAWTMLPLLLRTLFRFAEFLFITLVVELALALPMAIYFHRITLYALPVNLCILPLLGVLLPTAMLLLLVLTISTAWPIAATSIVVIPAAACTFLLHASVAIVRQLGSLSLGDVRIPQPSSPQVAATLCLLVLSVLLAATVFSEKRRVLQRCLSLVTVIAMVVTTLWPRAIEHPANALLFEAIDVGQGDSLLLISPEGKTLLIDGGGIGFRNPNQNSPQAKFDIGEEVVSTVLWSRGIRRLDAVALSHAHNDHMGGLPAILRNFRPRELWIGNNPAVPAYTALLHEASSLGVHVRPLHAGESLPFGQAEIRVLGPSRSYHPGAEPKNDDSLALFASYKSTSILLPGDAEAPEEDAMLREPAFPSATILKVGHHGSLTSTRPEFLARVAPAWAVISCGRRNHFGHPRPEILAELQAAHTRTFRTDIAGATCFVLDGHSVTPQSMCGADSR